MGTGKIEHYAQYNSMFALHNVILYYDILL